MQANDLTPETLRRLAELRPPRGRVWSFYLNLDPSEFATAQARSTAIRSLLDEADRALRGSDGLDHEDQVALRADLDRVRAFFAGDGFSAKGAHAVAVFCSGPADLFEAIRLPRPVESEVVIDTSPHVEPLADFATRGTWCVALVSRRTGRILHGSREGLAEVARIEDDVHGWHDQGGWSQARYQRGIEKETHDHVKRTADALMRALKRQRFHCLLVGAVEDMWPQVEAGLHPYLRERLVGRVDVEVEHATPDEVLAAAAPLMEAEDRRRERTALDRVAEGLGASGRAAAALDAVLAALTERRVETLLVGAGFSASGAVCPRCGWLGASGDTCPVDGEALEQRPNVLENAIESAIAQSARVLVVHHHEDDLEAHGGIAAVLRF